MQDLPKRSGVRRDADMPRNDMACATPSIHIWLYDANGTDCEVSPDRLRGGKLKNTQLLWIDLTNPDQQMCAYVEARLSVDPDALRRALDPDRPLLLDNYGDHFGLTVRLAPKEGDDNQRFSFIVGRNWLITVSRHPSPDFVSDFRKQDKGETKIGRLTSIDLLAALLDWHLAAFFNSVSDIETRADALDDAILHGTGQTGVLQQLVQIRVSISSLRRALADQRPVFYALARPDIASLLPEGAGDLFYRLGERLDRAIDEVERTRDVLVGSFDLFTSLSAQTTNELVKVLTFVTVVIGISGAVAGLFGMNFEMQLFKSGFSGFITVVAALVGLSGAALLLAKRRNWI